MVIYEVNLTIDQEIYSQFVLWLNTHVKEMLHFPGFIQASFLQPEENRSLQESLTIQYLLQSRADLEHYLTEFAPKMREEGVKRFKDKFSITRRVFSVQKIVKNPWENGSF